MTLSAKTLQAIDGWARKFIAAHRLPAQQTTRLTRQVVRVVETNMRTQRMDRYSRAAGKNSRVTLRQYVKRVAQSVVAEHARIAALERGDADAWWDVRTMLAKRAYHLLCDLRGDAVARAEAVDFANDTCAIIFDSAFPFDVAFAAWATRILRNCIFQTYARSPDVLNHEPTRASLDAPRSPEDGQLLGETVPHPASAQPFDVIEDRALICEAAKQLRSAPQRRAVQAIIVEGMTAPEFAAQEGISEQAVYNLCHRAVKKIKQILGSPHEQEKDGKSHHSSSKPSRSKEAK